MKKKAIRSIHFYTKKGDLISFKWHHEMSPDYGGKEQGWIVHQLDAFVEGKHAGYLRISYIPKSRWDKLFPTFWHWILKNEDLRHLPKKRQKLLSKFESVSKKRFLKNPSDRDSLIDALGTGIGYGMYMWVEEQLKKIPQMSPREYVEWAKEREKILQEYKENHIWEFKEKKQFHVDRPLVDYIRVDPEFQRQGIGTALYQEGARILASKGLPLYASGIQTEEAQAAWKNMKTLKKIPVVSEGKRTKIDYTTRFNKNRTAKIIQRFMSRQDPEIDPQMGLFP